MTTDWGHLAHLAAEAHLNAVLEWCPEDAGEESSPATAPYCGCTTCDIREILAGAWPVIEQMVAAARLEKD